MVRSLSLLFLVGLVIYFSLSLTRQPHCIQKFAVSFGPLDWSSTSKSLQFMPFDRQVRDLNWKIVHGVLSTAERLISFGYQYQLSCFCG